MLRMLSFCLIFFSLTLSSVGAAPEPLQEIIRDFKAELPKLNVKRFDYSYVQNLKDIPSLQELRERTDFFLRFKKRLLGIRPKTLAPDLAYRYAVLMDEIDLSLERFALERSYRSETAQSVPEQGLFKLPAHKRWYHFYVRKWSSDSWSPEKIYSYGLREVRRTVSEYRKIQNELGYAGKDEAFYAHLNQPAFTMTKESELIEALKGVQKTVQENLANVFDVGTFSPIEFRPIPNPDKNSPPGYYDNEVKTFYYNFFENRFPKRALEWLYMHEAVPGHHYQQDLADKISDPIAAKDVWYPGYEEGWGAYVENLGSELRLLQDPYQRLGKWEWDMVRSVRLVLDVALNYKGWSKEKALKFWTEHIPNQNHIAMREIERMIRWPAQVLSYKVGERAILDLRDYCSKKQRLKFNLKSFHTLILKRGPLPLPVLKQAVRDSCQQR